MFNNILIHWDWSVFCEVLILGMAFCHISLHWKNKTGRFQSVHTQEDLRLVIFLGVVGLAAPTALQAGGLIVYVGYCYTREYWRDSWYIGVFYALLTTAIVLLLATFGG